MRKSLYEIATSINHMLIHSFDLKRFASFQFQLTIAYKSSPKNTYLHRRSNHRKIVRISSPNLSSKMRLTRLPVRDLTTKTTAGISIIKFEFVAKNQRP